MFGHFLAGLRLPCATLALPSIALKAAASRTTSRLQPTPFRPLCTSVIGVPRRAATKKNKKGKEGASGQTKGCHIFRRKAFSGNRPERIRRRDLREQYVQTPSTVVLQPCFTPFIHPSITSAVHQSPYESNKCSHPCEDYPEHPFPPLFFLVLFG